MRAYVLLSAFVCGATAILGAHLLAIAEDDEGEKSVSFRVQCASNDYEQLVEVVLENGGRVFDLKTDKEYEPPQVTTSVPGPIDYAPLLVSLRRAADEKGVVIDMVSATRAGAEIYIGFRSNTDASIARQTIESVFKRIGSPKTFTLKNDATGAVPTSGGKVYSFALLPVSKTPSEARARVTVRRIALWRIRTLMRKHEVSVYREGQLRTEEFPDEGLTRQTVEMRLHGTEARVFEFLGALEQINGLAASQIEFRRGRGRSRPQVSVRFEIAVPTQ